MHNQGLSIRHRRNGNIPIKLEGFTHTCTKGDVGDLTVGLDLGEDGGQSDIGCSAVGDGFGRGKKVLSGVRRISIYGRGGEERGNDVPSSNPCISPLQTQR